MTLLEKLGFGSWTARASAEGDEATATVRKIVATLDQLPPEKARFIAAFAYILSRVARADLMISAEEIAVMERVVREQGGLGEAQAVLIVQMAKTQTILFGGTENFLVTREFDRLATRDEKIGLLRCLFAVSAADDSISTVEDNEVRRISQELHLTHQDFVDARVAYRDKLSVLKPGPPTDS